MFVAKSHPVVGGYCPGTPCFFIIKFSMHFYITFPFFDEVAAASTHLEKWSTAVKKDISPVFIMYSSHQIAFPQFSKSIRFQDFVPCTVQLSYKESIRTGKNSLLIRNILYRDRVFLKKLKN